MGRFGGCIVERREIHLPVAPIEEAVADEFSNWGRVLLAAERFPKPPASALSSIPFLPQKFLFYFL